MQTSSTAFAKSSHAANFSRWIVRVFAILAVLAAFVGARAAAQATSGVTGVVTDPSGAIMTGVAVTLANAHTGFSADTRTNDQGIYQFTVVPTGDGYELTFSATGFKKTVVANVSLGIGVIETRDAQMQIGETVQEVEVTVQGESTLNTEDSSIGNVIQQNQVAQLPIQARLNSSVLLELQPGVQAEGSSDQYGSVTGARADQQTITLDGLDVTDEVGGFAFDTVGATPIDSIQEVRTIVGSADSSYGRASSAQVDLSTQPGTNAFHGSLREYNRNTDFEANTFFNNLTDVPRPVLIRNQFGGNLGGPIMKNKFFFFFDYDGLRQTARAQVLRSVPVDALRNGGINYIYSGNDSSGQPCTGAARLNTDPSCIVTLTSAQVTAMDPAGTGADPALVTVFKNRYPEPNFPSGGDGINTEGFLFNAPDKDRENTFIGRVDFNLTTKQQIFARGTWDRNFADEAVQQFPGDPEALSSRIDHNRSFVVGYTYSITSSMVNKVYAGLTRSVLFFPADYAPSAPNDFNFGYYTSLSGPYGGFGSQGRNVGIPEVRDEFSWEKGHHRMDFGGDMRFIRYFSDLSNSINFVNIGLQANFANLDASLRPADINADHGAQQEWDGTFTSVLGSISGVSTNFYYDTQGNPLNLGSSALRNYVSNDFGFYGQDTWHITSALSLSYGLRWEYHGVPYERSGFESTGNLSPQALFAPRLANAAAGVNGNAAAPLLSINLAGPANHAPGYYKPDYKDFAPKLGLAYSPSFTHGVLGTLFGDRKTSFRAGAGIVYDRVLNTLEFELDQFNFLFSSLGVPAVYGSSADPTTSLMNNPRFTAFNSAPAPTPSPIPHPYTPNVDGSGNPIGLADFGGFPGFFNFDPNLKNPYAITASFGLQRELPGNFILETDYFGRFGHRLPAIGDAAQQLNFKDPASGQFLNDAFGAVEKQLQSGTPATAVTAQPWFENQVGAAAAANYGATCQDFFGGAGFNCTQVAAIENTPYIPFGDLSSTDLVLAEFGLLLPNTGLLAQTGSAGYIGNYSASSYNSLIIVLRKRLSHGLQFDFDYAFAHSIDNVSDVNNSFVDFQASANGLVCDLRNLRTCRASSDFDARHTVSANYVYNLPLGRGQRFMSSAPKWLDEILGGWGTSGIITWHSGFALNTSTGTFPIDFTMSAPAVYVGPASNVKQHITVDTATQTVQFFANPTNAINAFAYPFGGGTGNRNSLRGPNYSNTDMGLFKYFAMPWSDNQKLQFRADAFNVFNSVSFAAPGTSINNPTTFGFITSQENAARVLQVALRYEF